jgi:hypothetical protein
MALPVGFATGAVVGVAAGAGAAVVAAGFGAAVAAGAAVAVGGGGGALVGAGVGVAAGAQAANTTIMATKASAAIARVRFGVFLILHLLFFVENTWQPPARESLYIWLPAS